MKKIYSVLKNTLLFKGITEDDMLSMLNCLAVKQASYHKNEFIFTAGDEVRKIGIILAGSVQIVKEDIWGNRTILAKLAEGDLFGEAFSCSNIKNFSVSVISAENCEILFIDYRRIIITCSSSCSYHNRLIENMMQVMANKNIMLTEKMEIISKRSTREKLLSYLSNQAKKCGSNAFVIPFNRQELADYLCIDRSALSKELGKLRDEGILLFHRSHFELKKSMDA